VVSGPRLLLTIIILFYVFALLSTINDVTREAAMGIHIVLTSILKKKKTYIHIVKPIHSSVSSKIEIVPYK